MSYISVDCEAYGASPATGRLTEFGAVVIQVSRQSIMLAEKSHCELCRSSRRLWFHGQIQESKPSKENPAVPTSHISLSDFEYQTKASKVFESFEIWLKSFQRPVFWSDNVAFDWQWINCGFWQYRKTNPFGHSGRRISDFYAGLTGQLGNTQKWKRLRKTPHDHNPVHDAIGNAEALERILAGDR